MESSIILPNGVDRHEVAADTSPSDRVMVVNETGLPNDAVMEAVRDDFVEHASFGWGNQTTFQTYANQGNLLARSDYRTPSNVFDEIRLARDLADRDDDVRASIGWLLAAAFEQGMENFHEDERTVALYDSVAKEMNLDRVLNEFYREYLISGQINSVTLFTRTNLEYQPFGAAAVQQESVAVPVAGALPAENIRVLGNDIFGTGTLAYDPDSDALRRWLDEYFDPQTSAGRKADLGRQDRVSASMFTKRIPVDPFAEDASDLYSMGQYLYLLNPNVVQRTTMPKGAKKYPTPPLTANFALLEAKRLLNIMDYALLQGGSNFIVIVRKGTDQHPAQPAEMDALKEMVRRTARTGVMVGDHRLSIDVITPDLTSLLNPEKRTLIGRKLSGALLRCPEHVTERPGTAGMEAEVETKTRVVTNDRNAIRRHVEGSLYEQVRRRNRSVFSKGVPQLWFSKVVLQGSNYFTDYVLKLADRGNIPRKWAVEAGGFPFEAAIQQRQRELDQGVDDVLIPAPVPFSSPDMGPQDNNTGRPPGAQDGRPSQDPAAPKRRVQRNPGETVKAVYDEAAERVFRVGELTHSILDEYDGGEPGRVQDDERSVISAGSPRRHGSKAMVPVNHEVETAELRALNLTKGLRMVVGKRVGDGAFLAKLLIFTEPEFSTADAETRVARWGFPVAMIDEGSEEA